MFIYECDYVVERYARDVCDLLGSQVIMENDIERALRESIAIGIWIVEVSSTCCSKFTLGGWGRFVRFTSEPAPERRLRLFRLSERWKWLVVHPLELAPTDRVAMAIWMNSAASASGWG